MRRGAVAPSLLLVLMACGGGGVDNEGSSNADGESTTSSTASESTTSSTASEPTVTGAPAEGPTATDSTPGDAVSPAPSTTEDVVTSPTVTTEFGNPYSWVDGSTTTTTEAPWDGLTMPLTGEPAPDGWPERPALVVKVGNNDWRSLPQLGLEAADIVYEVMVENFVTRFNAVFHSELPATVRPVRSARSSDIDLVANLDRPMFAYWGSNEGVADEVRGAERLGVLVARSTIGRGQEHFSRDESRRAPYNGTVEPAGVLGSMDEYGMAPGPLFTYGPPADLAVRTAGVRWTTANRDVVFAWDADLGRWVRYQDGVPHLDAGGEPFAADNVLKLTVGYRKSDADWTSPQLLSTGSGDGWLFRDGTVTGVVWSRQFVADGWSILDDDTGERIHLDTGSTWVLMTRLGEGEILDASEVGELTD